VDLLQKQIAALSAKIDALHQVVEQLSDQVTQAIAEGRLTTTPAASGRDNHQASHGYSTNADHYLDHKDILMDGNHADSRGSNSEKPLTQEVQIQRLTAQLTAAYNQIAALEERLLSRRVTIS
jgi:hypothetical protein